MDEPPQQQCPFKVGDIIKDHYVLMREIGAGAFGAIFVVKKFHY
jgi:hypothetical protein